MRKLLLLSAILLLALVQGFSQNARPPAFTGASYTPPLTIYGPNVPDMRYSEKYDMQEQFLNRSWTAGQVKFKNGQSMTNLLLLFDVHSNKLYYMKDNVPMEFVYPVEEFVIGLVIGRADTVGVLYRSAYPLINYHTEETFYEVLVDGKFQLLRCRAKNVALYKDGKAPEQNRNTEKEQLYAFLPNGKIVKIKKDKDAILEVMPEYASRIEQILDDQKMKLKQDEGVRKLFIALNQK